jgi:hypothetical protein
VKDKDSGIEFSFQMEVNKIISDFDEFFFPSILLAIYYYVTVFFRKKNMNCVIVFMKKILNFPHIYFSAVRIISIGSDTCL